MIKNIFFFLTLITLFSFDLRKFNSSDHIVYLQKVNEIDSIYRLKNDTLGAIKLYQELFKKYPPHNSYLVNEYQTYIMLSEKYHRNFGGKESLYKLIPLVAPNWKYNRMDKDFFKLYNKYGIDSIEVEMEIKTWKKSLNKRLIDSFAIAIKRDQEKQRSDRNLLIKNDKKNEKLLTWTFSNYGYPSLNKIGVMADNDLVLSIGTILIHMASSEKYPYFKDEIMKYVKNGECPPQEYAEMIDKHGLVHNEEFYGTFINVPIKDSAFVNKNRKRIGMPSLKHSKKIHDEYFKR